MVSGVNDGSALIAMGLKITSIKPLVAIGLLSVAVVTGPVLFGTRVATTSPTVWFLLKATSVTPHY